MPTAPATQLDVDRAALRRLCEQYGVRWLAVFGSVARGDARPDSDVDVLYELRPNTPMGYFELESLAEALAPLLGGRPVDIGRPAQLHWAARARAGRGQGAV